MKATPDNWGRAYARQARVDFEAWNALQSKRAPALPACQKLHFLQMACEKLCKAHLCKQPGADPGTFQSSHAYTAKNLGIIIREQLSGRSNKPGELRDLLKRCKRVAREIELLHPAVDDGGRQPANCEYPWEQGGEIYIPAEWLFPWMNLLEKQSGPMLLKLIWDAIRRLEQ